MKKQPINPLTLRGTETRLSDKKVNLTLLRLGLGRGSHSEYKLKPGQQRVKQGQEEIDYSVSFVMWTEGTDGTMRQLGTMTMDHDTFVRGLGHLFPNGELEKIHLE